MKKKIKTEKFIKTLPGRLSDRILSVGSGYHSGLPYITLEIPRKDNSELWAATLSFAFKLFLKKNEYNPNFLVDVYAYSDQTNIEFRYARRRKDTKIIKKSICFEWDKFFYNIESKEKEETL